MNKYTQTNITNRHEVRNQVLWVIAKIAIAITALILFGTTMNYGITRAEQNECHKWASQAETIPNFYTAQWQRNQCDHYGINLDKR